MRFGTSSRFLIFGFPFAFRRWARGSPSPGQWKTHSLRFMGSSFTFQVCCWEALRFCVLWFSGQSPLNCYHVDSCSPPKVNRVLGFGPFWWQTGWSLCGQTRSGSEKKAAWCVSYQPWSHGKPSNGQVSHTQNPGR